MRTFKTKAFARFADREGMGDGALRDAVRRAGKGLIDADLGGGVIKRPVAGFAKSDRENLRRDELEDFRTLADEMLRLDDVGREAALADGTTVEANYDG